MTDHEKEVVAVNDMQGMDHIALRYEASKGGYFSESGWESDKFFIDLVQR